jgi:beta-galactosidase
MLLKNLRQLYALIVICFVSFSVKAQVRIVTNLNQNWQFSKRQYTPGSNTNTGQWESISIPHTWNKTDAFDDTPGYYRAACWYRKTLVINNTDLHKKLFLYFNGANQETEVYINGQKVGNHIGGYTRFCFEIDKYIKAGNNEIAVKVDNSFNANIAPLTADFTFYGGIYRSVYLIATNDAHFGFDNASNGVFITTPDVSVAKAAVKITGQVDGSISAQLQVVNTITDGAGKKISTSKIALTGSDFSQSLPQVLAPHLWSPEDPYLYKVTTQIVDTKSGKILDEVVNPLAFRWFKFDAAKGFFLNNKPYKLMGTNRHQDFEGLGNAIPESYNERDIELLKQMGGNFIRISHYPQDPKVLETCDRLGIMASVEIPVVNTITENETFAKNCENMQVEMIRQNFNHPSVIIWAYMNEILLVHKFADDKPRLTQYFANVKTLAKRLDSLTRKEDPSRYTMLSMHGDFNKYKTAGLIDIPMLSGWNLYNGWYGGKVSDFGPALDLHHREYPNQPEMVTEFGADADPRIRAFDEIRFDKSVDFAVNFDKTFLKGIEERPFVMGGAIWNLADFGSEGRAETMPHFNNKGLLTMRRDPKDIYFFYKANLSKKPFIKISNWVNRAGVSDSLRQSVCNQQIMVFSNGQQIDLKVNGVNIGHKTIEDGMTVFNVPFKNGLNKIEAVASIESQSYKDEANVQFNLIPNRLQSDKQADLNINVLLGAKRFYTDKGQTTWILDQAYKAGSFGSVGGIAYAMPVNSRQSYGTDRNILKTEDDPIYQTQQVGLQAYKFDVPNGRYEVVLHFAELTTDKAKEALAYNLDKGSAKETSQERVFDVLVNTRILLKNFSAADKYGAVTAGTEKTVITVTDGKGITIYFKAIKGEPILNAIQLKKIN